MEEFVRSILAILLSVATVTGIVVWAVKEIFKKYLQIDTERQKNRLALEHQKFTRLQNEQFETLKTIYANLIRTDELVNETFGLIKDGMEFSRGNMERTFKPLVQTIYETERHFRQNSIFLPESICKVVSKTIDSLFFCLTKSTYAVTVRSQDVLSKNNKGTGLQQVHLAELPEHDRVEFFEVIKNVAEVKDGELKHTMKIVQSEFKQMFGVE